MNFPRHIKCNNNISKLISIHTEKPSHLLLADPVLNNTIEWIENLEITISCSSVDGVPRPNVSWIYHPDIFVTESNDSVWSNITFTPTRHYNEQVYICKAEHDMLPISLTETVILNVLCKYFKTILNIIFPFCYFSLLKR